VRARGSSKNRGRISEVDAVSSQIGASFLGIPLEGHELTVCTIVHTRKHGAPRRLFLGQSAAPGCGSAIPAAFETNPTSVAPASAPGLVRTPPSRSLVEFCCHEERDHLSAETTARKTVPAACSADYTTGERGPHRRHDTGAKIDSIERRWQARMVRRAPA